MSNLDYTVEILEKENPTHDVVRFVLERPQGFEFTPGQAIEVNIAGEDGLDDSPFTLTGLPNINNLELILKVYPSHQGTTLALSELEVGDKLDITEPFDTFKYKTPGIFIAGGTGITPFVAILRQLNQDGKLDGNKLIFANKKEEDIFLSDELRRYLGDNLTMILSEEDHEAYFYGRVDKDFLEEHFSIDNQQFYMCGPDGFSESIKGQLMDLGVDEKKIMVEY